MLKPVMLKKVIPVEGAITHLYRDIAAGKPALMAAAIFRPGPMGLRDRLLDINIDDRLSYDGATNTVFLNFSGMRVRRADDIATIVAAVDRLLGPLGRRVNSIVSEGVRDAPRRRPRPGHVATGAEPRRR